MNRATRVPAALAAAAVSSLVLVGCGTQVSGAGAAPAGAAGDVRPVSVTTAPASPADAASAKRFTKIAREINAQCRVTPPGRPGPADIPGLADLPVDGGYGPDNPPPTIDGIGPDPNSSEGPPQDYTRPLEARDHTEVPLDEEDRCITGKHADRIRAAFGGKGTTSAETLRATLLKLDYPASRVHAMPDQGGSPRVRVDLRIDSQAALEIVGTASVLIVEPFGAVAHPNLEITKVKHKPELAAPAS